MPNEQMTLEQESETPKGWRGSRHPESFVLVSAQTKKKERRHLIRRAGREGEMKQTSRQPPDRNALPLRAVDSDRCLLATDQDQVATLVTNTIDRLIEPC